MAAHIQFLTLEEVQVFVDQVKSQLANQLVHVNLHDTSLRWLPSRGEEYSIQIYGKGAEIKKYDYTKMSPDMRRLVDESVGLVRVEVQLRGRSLRKFGLVNVGGWTK